MTLYESVTLYNANQTIPIFNKNGYMEERDLTITITDMHDKLQIKVRDISEYSFNFTEKIDVATFEIMRLNQSLDINFSEFKTNLIEMLQQFQRKEMLVKCQLSGKMCTVIFYEKTKIKSLIFLTLDLHLTNQDEIINEIVSEIKTVQETNGRLQKQLANAKNVISEKDNDNKQLLLSKKNMEEHYLNSLKKVEHLINIKLNETQNRFTKVILIVNDKIFYLQQTVEVLKQENGLKTKSSARLLKTMENLRLETTESASMIKSLNKDLSSLNTLCLNLEKEISDLKQAIQEKDRNISVLEKKKVELEKDLEKSSVVIAKLQENVDEFRQDLIKANGMLVNFNNHYDNKAKEAQELQAALSHHERQLMEQKARTNELLKEYESYRNQFNNETQQKLNHEICNLNRRITEISEENRRINKINALLTEKINVNMGIYK